jgi:uncharacterized alkaline shock family protein YloU
MDKNQRNESANSECVELEGEICINHAVVANIIRLCVLEVPGVAQVGGSFLDGVAEIFSRRDSDRGVSVKEEEDGRYAITVRVILYFGVPLMEVGMQIQQNIARQVLAMTHRAVARVGVVIDGVKVRNESAPNGDSHENN